MKTSIKKLNEAILKGKWQDFVAAYVAISQLPEKIKAQVEEIRKRIAEQQQNPGFHFQPGEISYTTTDQIHLNLEDEGAKYTPLMFAIDCQQPEMVKALLTGGIDLQPKATADSVTTPAKIETKLETQETKAEVNAANTTIQAATVLPALLKVNPNFKNSQGETPLSFAIRKGRVAMIEILLANGAILFTEAGLLEYNHERDFVTSPLGMALRTENCEVIFDLVKVISKEMLKLSSNTKFPVVFPKMIRAVLIEAIQRNNPPLVEYALSLTLALDPAGLVDTTPILHLAVQGRNLDIIKILLRNLTKTEINKINQSGSTALHQAISIGNPEIVRALLEAGASYILQNKSGQHALQQAALIQKPLQLFKVFCETIKDDKANNLTPYLTDGLIQLLQQPVIDDESIEYLLKQKLDYDNDSLLYPMAARSNLKYFLELLKNQPGLIKEKRAPLLLKLLLERLVKSKEEKDDHAQLYLSAVELLVTAIDLKHWSLIQPPESSNIWPANNPNILVKLANHIAETGQNLAILLAILQKSAARVSPETFAQILNACLKKNSQLNAIGLEKIIAYCDDSEVLRKSSLPPNVLTVPKEKILRARMKALDTIKALREQRLVEEELRVFMHIHNAEVKSSESKATDKTTKQSVLLFDEGHPEVKELEAHLKPGLFLQQLTTIINQSPDILAAFSSHKLAAIFDWLRYIEQNNFNRSGRPLLPLWEKLKEIKAYEVMFMLREGSSFYERMDCASPYKEVLPNMVDFSLRLMPHTFVNKQHSAIERETQDYKMRTLVNTIASEKQRGSATLIDLYFNIEQRKAGVKTRYDYKINKKYIFQHEKIFIQLLCFLTKKDYGIRKNGVEINLVDAIQALARVCRGLNKANKPYNFARMLERLLKTPAIVEREQPSWKPVEEKIKHLQEQFNEFAAFMQARFPQRWKEMLQEVDRTAEETASLFKQDEQKNEAPQLPLVHASPLANGNLVTPAMVPVSAPVPAVNVDNTNIVHNVAAPQVPSATL